MNLESNSINRRSFLRFAAAGTASLALAHPAFSAKSKKNKPNVLFMAIDEPVLVIASGPARIDRRALADYLGLNRRKVEFAKAEQVLAITGYPVGAVPPLGHRQKIRVLVDPGVLEHQEVYGGGGSGQALVRLNPQDILDHNQAEVLKLQEQK